MFPSVSLNLKDQRRPSTPLLCKSLPLLHCQCGSSDPLQHAPWLRDPQPRCDGVHEFLSISAASPHRSVTYALQSDLAALCPVSPLVQRDPP